MISGLKEPVGLTRNREGGGASKQAGKSREGHRRLRLQHNKRETKKTNTARCSIEIHMT